jgi:excisionase family DNA binding protein
MTEKMTVSVVEAGRILGLSPATSYRLVHENVIPALRLGRQLRVPIVQLEKLLSEKQLPIEIK